MSGVHSVKKVYNQIMIRVVSYSYMPSRARCAVLLLSALLPLLLGGCAILSSLSAKPSESLPLDSLDEGQAADWSLTQLSRRPFVYRLNGPMNGVNLYVTALKECGITASRSTRATTRQLFAGFDSLRFERQELVAIGQNTVLLTIASTSLDGQPIHMASFSRRSAECVFDVVLWTPDTLEQNPITETSNSYLGRATQFMLAWLEVNEWGTEL